MFANKSFFNFPSVESGNSENGSFALLFSIKDLILLNATSAADFFPML